MLRHRRAVPQEAVTPLPLGLHSVYRAPPSHFFPLCCFQYEWTGLGSCLCLCHCGDYDKTVFMFQRKSNRSCHLPHSHRLESEEPGLGRDFDRKMSHGSEGCEAVVGPSSRSKAGRCCFTESSCRAAQALPASGETLGIYVASLPGLLR